jgi:hypothetical protein
MELATQFVSKLQLHISPTPSKLILQLKNEFFNQLAFEVAGNLKFQGRFDGALEYEVLGLGDKGGSLTRFSATEASRLLNKTVPGLPGNWASHSPPIRIPALPLIRNSILD